MASGRSLELKKFDEEHSLAKRQKVLCVCGEVWEGPKHFTKDKKLRAAVAKDVRCYPTGRQGILVKAMAAVEAGRKVKK